MAFVADITIADDTAVAAGEQFTKTWLVQNTGTADWAENYALAFVKGDRLDAPDHTALGKQVRPGASIDLAVAMRAPAAPGRYTGWWRLVDDSGEPFGQPVYVRIVVGSGEAGEEAASPGESASASLATASSGAYLVTDNAAGVWIWSAPNGQHMDQDSLVTGSYRVLQQTADMRWTQVQAGDRAAWVFTGADSGTHRLDGADSTSAGVQQAVAKQAPAQIATVQLLAVAQQDPRQAVELWKARVEWNERARHPASALSTNNVPGIAKGPDAIYRVIDAQTSEIMARLPYSLFEPILFIQHVGIFVPGHPPLGIPGPPVPAGVEALNDEVQEVAIRFDYVSAPNPNFPMPADKWPKIRPWSLLATLAHEGRHIMAHRGDNHEEAVSAQKAILLAGAKEMRASGDEASAVLLERLASVVRSGIGNPVTGAF
jgi:hypothetical protein